MAKYDQKDFEENGRKPATEGGNLNVISLTLTGMEKGEPNTEVLNSDIASINAPMSNQLHETMSINAENGGYLESKGTDKEK